MGEIFIHTHNIYVQESMFNAPVSWLYRAWLLTLIKQHIFQICNIRKSIAFKIVLYFLKFNTMHGITLKMDCKCVLI